MDFDSFHRAIAIHRETISGEYTSATRIIDALLDLRLMAADMPALTELIDSMMAEVPGWFVATNVWWTEQLDRIERHVLTEETGRPAAASG